ncbi:M48 family metalloprotease [Streptomyces sp. NPDC050732]|uniref:M48 family metalloprotease n=1 Tax=Streptomyces sp. NPDC050732 TaxID=3154632 RepID=UPI003447CE22
MSPPHEPERPDPDELAFRKGRIHIAARQRHADAFAVGRVLLHLPEVLISTALIFTLSYVLDALIRVPWWLPLSCWGLSGALVFHRPSERAMARWFFGLRHPTPEEQRQLSPIWREVTARAGVNGDAYQLWVEESDDINAMAAAGHIVGVTSHSLRTLPSGQLGSVLAHELGHHTRGHAWASLLTYWYALPARLAWWLLRLLFSHADRLSTMAKAIVVALLCAIVLAAATATYGLVFLPLATPYLLAAVARRAELRADRHAAALGFAQQLMTVLRKEHDSQESERAAAAALGSPLQAPSLATRLLASHPDLHTRLYHLQATLDARR